MPSRLVTLWSWLLIVTAAIDALLVFAGQKLSEPKTALRASFVLAVFWAVTSGVTAFGTAFLIYLTWTRIGFDSVEGLQARHILAPCLAAFGTLLLFRQVQPQNSSFIISTSRLAFAATLLPAAIFFSVYSSYLALALQARYW